MRENEKPSPLAEGDGLRYERLPDRLDKDSRQGAAVRQPIPRERIARLARQIHRLGERPLLELLAELDAGRDLHPVLERYARLAPFVDFIEAAYDGRVAIVGPDDAPAIGGPLDERRSAKYARLVFAQDRPGPLQ